MRIDKKKEQLLKWYEEICSEDERFYENDISDAPSEQSAHQICTEQSGTRDPGETSDPELVSGVGISELPATNID